jgi:hypothetical protein
LVQRLRAYAALTGEYFSPRNAYAGVGLAGGSLGSLSPINVLDPLEVSATFNGYALGLLAPNPTDLERGVWTYNAPAPGSVTVVSALGSGANGLSDKPLAISQGGGNCTQCGTLLLTGKFNDDDAAANGIYEVSWESLQMKSSAKFAPIDLRSSDGKVIFRVAYKAVRSGTYLYTYRPGTRGPVEEQVVSWVAGVRNRFVVTVDFSTTKPEDFGTTSDKRSVTLKVLPPDGDTPVATVNLPFLDATATNFGRFVIELSQIDAGTLGLDNVDVRRLSDPIVP